MNDDVNRKNSNRYSVLTEFITSVSGGILYSVFCVEESVYVSLGIQL